ncbi:ABC transporter, phosphonate, periplasmic substrate-binding protein [Hoeflea sp. IMCC20628]|uniref:phosphate/phosphite/phosphonate ABC transporter substrate-binding protein n=1 Tax=Hoeflea sp. IMCC20628 TaxID=1620421 RepID=UPI00063BF698|nr:PhnD/SsuA/transferrin family substrate-binding protein [Hoeflea sp. IMCC20628]AKH99130.1 ABC transporter, phosphonate, periplasmic substrate-binding protein [Hoeflea sp. IMCC20628]
MSGAASLPMYDWPEIRHATDAVWTAIRQRLFERGIDAPVHLDRTADPEPLWSNPDLLLSQTCGYPYANRLTGTVALVGTPAHAVTGARPGHYFSALIARRDQLPEHLGELTEKRLAFNMTHSQSGFAAPVRLLAAGGHTSLPEPLETGAHRASIRAVADGLAGWAAIDAVTWELARRHEPAAEELAVFATTPQTPALPLITSQHYAGQANAIADAVEVAILGLETEIRDAILMTGLVRFKPADYAPLAAPLPVREALPGLHR